MERVILHCDCNSFFASVETALNPALRGVPMAVCGSEADRHGIVLAKNELAKGFGVVTAETVREAKRKCPQLVTVPPHHGEYLKYSKAVNAIYARYTDQIEPFGIDESWLDVTGSYALFGSGLQIAERIRQEVKREIGITVSIGVSFNKIFAKLGSDYKKPDAITEITRENSNMIVFPLPVGSLLFIGERTAELLASCSIRTIGDLAGANPAFLVNHLGKHGEKIYLYANGKDEDPVVAPTHEDRPKSVGNGMTFRHDLQNAEDVRIGIEALSEEVAMRLRRLVMKCTTVSATLRDSALKSASRQTSLQDATDSSREIARTAYQLVMQLRKGRPAIRSLTVTAMNLVDAAEVTEQIGFFDTERQKRKEKESRLDRAMDGIREKYGYRSIGSGAFYGNDLGISDFGPEEKEESK